MIHQPPSDLIELGQVFDAQGLKGHIKVRPYSPDPVALLQCKQICLQRDGARGASIDATYTVNQAKLHSGFVVMALEGVTDRDAALLLKGSSLKLPRTSFPKTEQGTYYWIDLIGCRVLNEEGSELGFVDEIAEYGAHPVMTVGMELIPFVPDLVKSVDLQASDAGGVGTIVVAWQANWSK